MYEKYNENSETIYDQLFMSEEADDDGVGWSKNGCEVSGLYLILNILNFRVVKKRRGWDKCNPWNIAKTIIVTPYKNVVTPLTL